MIADVLLSAICVIQQRPLVLVFVFSVTSLLLLAFIGLHVYDESKPSGIGIHRRTEFQST